MKRLLPLLLSPLPRRLGARRLPWWFLGPDQFEWFGCGDDDFDWRGCGDGDEPTSDDEVENSMDGVTRDAKPVGGAVSTLIYQRQGRPTHLLDAINFARAEK